MGDLAGVGHPLVHFRGPYVVPRRVMWDLVDRLLHVDVDLLHKVLLLDVNGGVGVVNDRRAMMTS